MININKDTTLCISLAARPGNFGTRFHNFLYGKLGLNFAYKAFTTQDIHGAIIGIRALGIRGCAVSMPFKESCMEFLDDLDGSARGIQSVNTIVNSAGRLIGSNTDYIAVRELLEKSGLPREARFALRGSGGMAKAAAAALRDAGFENGQIVARNEETGRKLAARYGFAWGPSLEGGASLLVNASPLGMTGGPEETLLPFPEEAVAGAQALFDFVALPVETPFLRLGRAKGKKLLTGAEVTTLQALEQFVLYTGVRPEAALVNEAAAFARS